MGCFFWEYSSFGKMIHPNTRLARSPKIKNMIIGPPAESSEIFLA
jgi:hypothetical protein